MRHIIEGIIIGTIGVILLWLAVYVAGWALSAYIGHYEAADTQPVSQECIITVPAEEWTHGDGRYRINL